MPTTKAPEYRVDKESGLVLLFDHGFLDFPGWSSSVLAALKEVPANSPRRFLSDRRRLTHPPSLGLVEEIIDFVSEHSKDLRNAQWAVVGQRGTSVQEILELSEHLARSTTVRLKAFTEIRPALVWLLPVESEIDRLERWIEDQVKQ